MSPGTPPGLSATRIRKRTLIIFGEDQSPEGWIMLEEFVTNNPLIKGMWLEVESRTILGSTRRTVQVATRKYRARKRRR